VSLASFHLARYPASAAFREMVRSLTQRRALGRVPGLRFARVLGTGRGSSTGWGADLGRWALFAAWESEPDLDRFLAESAVARHWDRAEEVWSVRLEHLGAHGAWGGRPLGREWMAAAMAAPVRVDVDPGPIAVLTRAAVRPRHWVRFHRAAGQLAPQLDGQSGLLARVGVGELPVGRLATLSFWSSGAELDRFVRGQDLHRDIVRRTVAEGWYREELFARFRPYGSSGTWDGTDPLPAG
jgi:hypothetical protein